MRPEAASWNPETQRQSLLEAEDEKEALALAQKHQRISQAMDLVRQEFEKIFSIRPDEMKFSGVLPELQKRGWDKPTLVFYENEAATQWLDSHNFSYERTADYPDALAVFQLPLPLARFWWKSKSSNLYNPMFEPGEVNYNDPELGQQNRERGIYWPASTQGPGVEEWGEMYWRKMSESFVFLDQVRHWRELTDPVAQKVVELLEPVGGWGQRLNDMGFHDAKIWYYLWGWWLNSEAD